MNEAIKNFLKNIENEKVPNKKLLQFFENNFEKMALKLDGTENELRGKDIWNFLIYRFFVNSPGLIKNNAEVIFSNLELARPKINESNGKN